MTTATNETIVVGFIGVGQIGTPIADQISKKYTTIVANRSQGALDFFRDRCEIGSPIEMLYLEIAGSCLVIHAHACS
jgi:pyrroline-5-carboxylate reductase